jgi:iron complex outermembrane receptor protein
MAQKETCAYSLRGKVLDVNTETPISNAVIKVKGIGIYTTTSTEGTFKIDNLCTKNNTLIISCLGYSNSTKDHEHDSAIHFYLTQQVTGLNEVVIQAKRRKEKGTATIAQVTIGKTAINSDPTQSLASALSQQQGITFMSAGTNVQLPVIHGLYGNRILVLNNGLKHGFQNWGADHAPEIDITSANSITVIKGAAGVRYGPEALGGAIIIEPNPLLLNNALYTALGTSYQTNGKGYNTNFEIGKGTAHWSYFANGNYTKIGDRNTPDYNLTKSKYCASRTRL